MILILSINYQINSHDDNIPYECLARLTLCWLANRELSYHHVGSYRYDNLRCHPWRQNYQWKLFPNSKVHWTNMEPIWGRQDPCWPHVGPMNFSIWVGFSVYRPYYLWWLITRFCRGNHKTWLHWNDNEAKPRVMQTRETSLMTGK